MVNHATHFSSFYKGHNWLRKINVWFKALAAKDYLSVPGHFRPNIKGACTQPFTGSKNIEWKIYREQLHSTSIKILYGFNHPNSNQWRLKEQQTPIWAVCLIVWTKRVLKFDIHSTRSNYFLHIYVNLQRREKKISTVFWTFTYICRNLYQTHLFCVFFVSIFLFPIDLGLNLRKIQGTELSIGTRHPSKQKNMFMIASFEFFRHSEHQDVPVQTNTFDFKVLTK